jgi:hypothetical protein
VSFGGLSFGTSTQTGKLAGTPVASAVSPVLGSYSVDLPPASAALLTR